MGILLFHALLKREWVLPLICIARTALWRIPDLLSAPKLQGIPVFYLFLCHILRYERVEFLTCVRSTDMASDHLTLPLEEGDEDARHYLHCHSITCRRAMGPQAGRKVLTLQTIPAREEDEFGADQFGWIGGLSLYYIMTRLFIPPR
jgi:hypothetical protein